jgi:hypothetical protein
LGGAVGARFRLAGTLALPSFISRLAGTLALPSFISRLAGTLALPLFISRLAGRAECVHRRCCYVILRVVPEHGNPGGSDECPRLRLIRPWRERLPRG